jgi:hypothetical protein
MFVEGNAGDNQPDCKLEKSQSTTGTQAQQFA